MIGKEMGIDIDNELDIDFDLDLEDLDLSDLDLDNLDLGDLDLENGKVEVEKETETITNIMEHLFEMEKDNEEVVRVENVTKDFNPITSGKLDVQQGVNYLREERRMNVGETWDQSPGTEIVKRRDLNEEKVNTSGEDIASIEYPIILITVVTSVMLETVKRIIEETSVKEGTGVYLKMGDSAIFLGKSFIDHRVYNKLLRLGLKPIYYESKGVQKRYRPEQLFDPTIYNERILVMDEPVGEEDPIIDLIPNQTYEHIETIPEPDYQEIDFERLLQDAQNSGIIVDDEVKKEEFLDVSLAWDSE